MKVKEKVKEIVDWMYSKDNPNNDMDDPVARHGGTKQETLRYFLKQNKERNEKIQNRH